MPKSANSASQTRSNRRHAVRKASVWQQLRGQSWVIQPLSPLWYSTFYWLKNLLLIALILGAISASLVWLQRPDTLPVKTVRITGQQQTLSQDLQQALLPYTQGGFFRVNLQKIRDTAMQLPWVRQADIYRQWPDTVLVRLTEHQPFAYWQAHSSATVTTVLPQATLLNPHGELFTVPLHDQPAGLPLLVGLPQQHPTVLQHYQHLHAQLPDNILIIHEFGFNPQQAWYIVLQTLPKSANLPSADLPLLTQFKVLLGRIPSETGMQQFLNFYQHIQQGLLPSIAKDIATARIVHIDVRYRHGVAVRIISEEDYAT